MGGREGEDGGRKGAGGSGRGEGREELSTVVHRGYRVFGRSLPTVAVEATAPAPVVVAAAAPHSSSQDGGGRWQR